MWGTATRALLDGRWNTAGENPATGIVAGITCNPGGSTLVTCVEDERLEFQVSTQKVDMLSSNY